AVSSRMASLVNHQSQLRVPPTPRTAALPKRSASGNSRPELLNSVVLPEPGGPMIMYQGSSSRFADCLPDLLSAEKASSNLLRSCASAAPTVPLSPLERAADRSRAAGSGAAAAPPISRVAFDACQLLHCQTSAQMSTTMRIATRRPVGEASGLTSANAK